MPLFKNKVGHSILKKIEGRKVKKKVKKRVKKVTVR